MFIGLYHIFQSSMVIHKVVYFYFKEKQTRRENQIINEEIEMINRPENPFENLNQEEKKSRIGPHLPLFDPTVEVMSADREDGEQGVGVNLTKIEEIKQEEELEPRESKKISVKPGKPKPIIGWAEGLL